MSNPSPPAGWYPDPQNPAQQRYWDGAAWSEATQPPAYGAPQGYGPAPVYGVPAGYGVAFGGAPPQNYLALAIIVTVLCGCFGGLLPLIPGIIAIVKAGQVNAKWQAGDAAGAAEASKQARNFSIACVVVSVVVTAVVISTGFANGSFEVE